jgi:regulator of replication initiation timing
MNSNFKNDLSMEIIKSRESDVESEGEHVVPLSVAPLKNTSQNLFELSLNRQHTLSFDIMALSYKENEEDDKVFLDIQEHIESMKLEIEKITEALVKISKENEILLEHNEKLAQSYLKTHDFIQIKEEKEPKQVTRSKYSKSNSNVNEEVFKYIDMNQLSPR